MVQAYRQHRPPRERYGLACKSAAGAESRLRHPARRLRAANSTSTSRRRPRCRAGGERNEIALLLLPGTSPPASKTSQRCSRSRRQRLGVRQPGWWRLRRQGDPDADLRRRGSRRRRQAPSPGSTRSTTENTDMTMIAAVIRTRASTGRAMTRTGRSRKWKLQFYSNGGNTYDVTFPVSDFAVLNADWSYMVDSSASMRVLPYQPADEHGDALLRGDPVQPDRRGSDRSGRDELGVLPEQVRLQNFYADSNQRTRPSRLPTDSSSRTRSGTRSGRCS